MGLCGGKLDVVDELDEQADEGDEEHGPRPELLLLPLLCATRSALSSSALVTPSCNLKAGPSPAGAPRDPFGWPCGEERIVSHVVIDSQ